MAQRKLGPLDHMEVTGTLDGAAVRIESTIDVSHHLTLHSDLARCARLTDTHRWQWICRCGVASARCDMTVREAIHLHGFHKRKYEG